MLSKNRFQWSNLIFRFNQAFWPWLGFWSDFLYNCGFIGM